MMQKYFRIKERIPETEFEKQSLSLYESDFDKLQKVSLKYRGLWGFTIPVMIS